MDELDDELDLRYHRGLNADVYYRCPTLESLDGALRNEMEKNAASLIPTEIITEFVFAVGSTITVPVAQQPNLEALIQSADFPQSITVELALCREINGKDRLKTQRAIARCFIETIQEIDGFNYSERQARYKDGDDGTRFKYICVDSLQNSYRKGNIKRENTSREMGEEGKKGKRGKDALPTYDCGGAIHIKFSIKRHAVNVVYKHNPIHRDVESRPTTEQNGDSCPPVLSTDHPDTSISTSDAKEPKKRKKSRKNKVEMVKEVDGPDPDMTTSPKSKISSPKMKRKGIATSTSPEATLMSTTKKQKQVKQTQSPLKTQKKAPGHGISSLSPVAKPKKGKACLRCKEKKIKCNEENPACDQCRRGLWVCQYVSDAPHKRSKNGCLNCRQRKRKCTEEKPSCAYCLKIDEDCEYAMEDA